MIWLAGGAVVLILVWAVVLIGAARCSSRFSEEHGEREGDKNE